MTDLKLDRIKALTWDVGGTVFDWHHTIRDEVALLATSSGLDLDAAQFTNDWRAQMFTLLGQMRSGIGPWENADALHLRSLDIVLDSYGWSLTLSERQDLNSVWHCLHAWDDAKPVLEALRDRFQIVVMTVMSWQIAVSSSKFNNISWDGVLSCEFLGNYKPDREAYLRTVELLGLEPHQVMMCAAHDGDLNAAMAAGLRSAYVYRPDERGASDTSIVMPSATSFDIVANDFEDLRVKLLS